MQIIGPVQAPVDDGIVDKGSMVRLQSYSTVRIRVRATGPPGPEGLTGPTPGLTRLSDRFRSAWSNTSTRGVKLRVSEFPDEKFPEKAIFLTNSEFNFLVSFLLSNIVQ